ncbi:hypothetical protein BO71DRAFT_193079 [Aspergillus ellipticus CBS 707.79]|uniref:Uncharacterized protein n=1 Tax=Aspergillus ellipticus CBS 707.79 TaxID=1448320 RepID=A0A319F3P5_9EURO|nr:hypothetical protein BO71DRAFT_193079 [Aspergillus ellipticus CBS 707.79]
MYVVRSTNFSLGWHRAIPRWSGASQISILPRDQSGAPKGQWTVGIQTAMDAYEVIIVATGARS